MLRSRKKLAAGGKGPNYEVETIAYLDEMDTLPSVAQQGLINDFVIELKDAGIFGSFDCLYLLMMHADQPSRVNLANPGTDTLVKNGSPTFSANSHWVGGSSAYLKTTTTADNFTQFTQDDACMGIWCNNSINENIDSVGYQTNDTEIRPYSGGYCYQMLNGSYSFAEAARSQSNSIGLSMITRVSSSAGAHYRDGTKQGASYSNTSGAPPASVFKICGGILGTSTAQLSFACIGASLSDTEASDLYDAVDNYRTGVAAL